MWMANSSSVAVGPVKNARRWPTGVGSARIFLKSKTVDGKTDATAGNFSDGLFIGQISMCEESRRRWYAGIGKIARIGIGLLDGLTRFLVLNRKSKQECSAVVKSGLIILLFASFAAAQSAAPMTAAQNSGPTTATITAPTTQAPAFEIVGKIDSPAIPESSGIVESRTYPGIFWTHNDSGNQPEVFAITREGRLINSFSIQAKNVDWEDIAIDEQGHLYLADIGNNLHERTTLQIYRIPEPNPRARSDTIVPDQVFHLRYPAQPFDAESLFFLGDAGYIIAKHLELQQAGIYRFDPKMPGDPQILTKVIDLPTRMPVTAADVSRDGKFLAIMSLVGPSVYRIDGDLKNVRKGPIWSAACLDPNIEAICFVKDGLLGTTERGRVLFFPLKDPSTTQPITAR
jgi:hypothetical protein